MFYFFFFLNGTRKHLYVLVSPSQNNFGTQHSDFTFKYSEVNIERVLEFPIDIIYEIFGDQVFQ